MLSTFKLFWKFLENGHCKLESLTETIFETGAYGVPSKSQNPTVLGQGGPSKGQ